jgi:hypothetical protein
MKTYISVLLVIAGLIVIVLGGYYFMKHKAPVKETPVNTVVHMKTVSGEVTRTFEGEHKLQYSFDIPETATTTISMEGALIRITDGANLLATVYLSYEGGRGYTALDYIDQTIAPKVAVVTPTGTTTVGVYDWQTAATTGSEWHLASLGNGEWLAVVESRKTSHNMVVRILESFEIQ